MQAVRERVQRLERERFNARALEELPVEKPQFVEELNLNATRIGVGVWRRRK